ncbi:MAG: flagellar hook-basal body complex protein [Clostridia bacterium]|nr:flagellar hook-basal body complex protein [Clostridia bacterium]
MNAGILQLGNSLLSYEKQLAVISNNIANADTDRFKNDTLVVKTFADYYIEQINKDMGKADLTKEVYTSFSQGIIEKSSDENEIAIDGKGFMVVSVNNSDVYSRGGSISKNLDGFLADENGNLIVGENGPIKIAGDTFLIETNGKVVSDEETAGYIKLIDFSDYSGLQKMGNDYYANSSNQQLIDSNAKVKQGYAEKSNADMTNEYLRMMEISRLYETNQKTIQIIDEINGKAANEMGRLY